MAAMNEPLKKSRSKKYVPGSEILDFETLMEVAEQGGVKEVSACYCHAIASLGDASPALCQHGISETKTKEGSGLELAEQVTLALLATQIIASDLGLDVTGVSAKFSDAFCTSIELTLSNCCFEGATAKLNRCTLQARRCKPTAVNSKFCPSQTPTCALNAQIPLHQPEYHS
eukprot:3377107-Rhodomonas_salina.2